MKIALFRKADNMSFGEFLLEFLTAPFTMIPLGYERISNGDWGMGVIEVFIGILVLATEALIISFICAFIYELIETSGPKARERGTVISTRYRPAHTTTIWNGQSHTLIYHPNRWYATFRVKGAREEVEITRKHYTHLTPGDQMDVLVTRGRLSKRRRIVSLASA